MKPFRFTLQSVQIVRQRQEQLALEQYAMELRARHEAAQKLAAAQVLVERAWQEWRRKLKTGCPGAEAAQAQAYHHALEAARDQCAQALEQVERSLARALQQMLAARQRREAVDQYYKNQRRRYDAEAHREQQKILDELGHRSSPAISFAWKKIAAGTGRSL